MSANDKHAELDTGIASGMASGIDSDESMAPGRISTRPRRREATPMPQQRARPQSSGEIEREHLSGTVYLLHFDRPYRHARHYCGWTNDLTSRLALHACGRGARLVDVVVAAGIGWQLARTWPGTRSRERALKRQGGASRRCPLCGVTPRPAALAEGESR